MFETVIAAMLKHKQIVFAAIAVAALSGMVVAPSTQFARAALGDDIANSVLDRVSGADDNEDQSGDDNQDIDQTQDQENDQEANVDQEVTQSNSQDETNVQANELDTGDNTATVAQSNREDQDVDADADVEDSSASAASDADAEDNDHIKAKKSHVSESDETSAESQAKAIIDATATATGIQGDQSNTATVDQDSSIHDVDLSNNVAFGDDSNTQVAVPISDIDQRAANLAEQRAANLDVEEDVFPYGFTSTSTTTTTTEEEASQFCQDHPNAAFCR